MLHYTVFRLTSQKLDLEIQLMKAKDRYETLEKRLLGKTASLESCRKEMNQCKNELQKLKKSTDGLPAVHSELLKVISLL